MLLAVLCREADFNQTEGDKIDFQVPGVNSFNDLDIDYSSGDAVVTSVGFGSGDQVTVVNYDGSDAAHTLTAGDFLFVVA